MLSNILQQVSDHHLNFQAICAKVENGDPCCDWVGESGSGHYVKMVHNGIEYGDMQVHDLPNTVAAAGTTTVRLTSGKGLIME